MTTKVSSYPPSDILSAIDQRSTINDICCDSTTRGCARKCPCRIWAQCNYYVDITERQARLKYKNNKSWKEINDWYDDMFRAKYEHSDMLGNG